MVNCLFPHQKHKLQKGGVFHLKKKKNFGVPNPSRSQRADPVKKKKPPGKKISRANPGGLFGTGGGLTEIRHPPNPPPGSSDVKSFPPGTRVPHPPLKAGGKPPRQKFAPRCRKSPPPTFDLPKTGGNQPPNPSKRTHGLRTRGEDPNPLRKKQKKSIPLGFSPTKQPGRGRKKKLVQPPKPLGFWCFPMGKPVGEPAPWEKNCKRREKKF